MARLDRGSEESFEKDSPEEAARFRARKRLGNNGAAIPPNALLMAKAQADAMRAVRMPDGDGIVSWRSLGPGNIGGRIRAMYVETTPAVAGFMMIGATGGGIWTSRDSGATWTSSTDFLPSLAVTAIVVDKSNPNAPLFYASTGEGFSESVRDGDRITDLVRGAGIYVSADWGEHWSQLPSTSGPNAERFYWVTDLAASPSVLLPGGGPLQTAPPRPVGTTGPALLAATINGIEVSSNGGTTWVNRLPTDTMADVDFSPATPLNAVAGSLVNGHAYYTRNMGRTWTLATWMDQAGNPIGSGFRGGDGRVELAYALSAPDVVYALVEEEGPPRQGRVFQSVDGGKTYRLRWAHADVFGYPGESDSFGYVHNTLWVAPNDPSLVVLGGINLWRSTDAGITFTPITAWDGAGQVYLHADQQIVVASATYGPSDRSVYVGNDGGLVRIPDIKAASIVPQMMNNGLGITQFYGGAIDGQGRVVGGAQDNGVTYTTGGSVWEEIWDGDGGFVQCHPDIPGTFFVTTAVPRIMRVSGEGFSDIVQLHSTLNDFGAHQNNFIPPILLDPIDAHCLYAGGKNLWRLNDPANATSSSAWTQVAGSSTGSASNFISTIAVAPYSSDVIWLGYNEGDVRWTQDGGSTWDALGIGTLPDRWVSDIEVVDSSTAFVTFMGFEPDNVWKTTDGGQTWAAMGQPGGALPSVPVSTIVSPCEGRVYVGTDLGVFASKDGGTTWIAPATGSGPVNVQVDQLFWNGADRTRLYAATFGRGVWEATLESCCDDETIELNPNLTRHSGFNLATSGSHLLLDHGNSSDFSLGSDRVLAYERGAGGWFEAGDLPRPACAPNLLSHLTLSFGVSGDRAVAAWGFVDDDGGFIPGCKVLTYVWNVPSGSWAVESELLELEDVFCDVAISGDRIVVGLMQFGDQQLPDDDSGAILFFSFNGQEWMESDRFALPPGIQSFGASVGLHGDTAIVSGNAGNDPEGNPTWHLYSYEYDVVSSSWDFVQEIPVLFNDYRFAFSGDVLTSGIFIYRRNADSGLWALEATLPDQISCIANMAVSDGTLAVAECFGTPFGAVHIVRHDGNEWSIAKTILNPTEEAVGYGAGLAMDGEALVVAMPGWAATGGFHFIPCTK